MANAENLDHSLGSNDEIVSKLDVMTISTELRIRAIFNCRYWSVEDGINYLVGIFNEYCDDQGLCHITTLSGKNYSEPEDKEIIDGFIERQNILMLVWQHGGRENKKYSKLFFIRWASQHQNICETTWLKDAKEKGFIDTEKPKEKIDDKVSIKTEESDLRSNERKCLLTIIAGLTLRAYKTHDRHGLQKKIRSDLDCEGCHVAENTLSKHLKDAWELVPNAGKWLKPQ